MLLKWRFTYMKQPPMQICVTAYVGVRNLLIFQKSFMMSRCSNKSKMGNVLYSRMTMVVIFFWDFSCFVSQYKVFIICSHRRFGPKCHVAISLNQVAFLLTVKWRKKVRNTEEEKCEKPITCSFKNRLKEIAIDDNNSVFQNFQSSL
jgi:hypothetical protein